MSRKDYEAIAQAIKDEKDDSWSESELVPLKSVAGRIASVFARDNPRFDRARFLRACGF